MQAAALGTRLAALVELDAQSYEAVSAAYKLPKETPEQETHAQGGDHRRADRRERGAARDGARVRGGRVARGDRRDQGERERRADAGVAALLAEAACKGAAFNVKVNVDALDDSASAHGLLEAARTFVGVASEAAARAAALVGGKESAKG